MLSKADDYPIHQTPEPIAYAGTDRNFYDRYFFNGYAPDGEHFFAVAMGVYPALDVIDASFALIDGGVQKNIHASRKLAMERMDISVGPIAIEVVEPLRALRVRVDHADSGIKADLLFTGRHRIFEEPRFTRRNGPRLGMDLTRMTQNGVYEGRLEIGGRRIDLTPDRFQGTRDRSWGIRSVGARDPQAPAQGQGYWLWAPLNFADCVTLFSSNQDAEGEAWHFNAVKAPADGPEGREAERFRDAESVLAFRPGTRQSHKAAIRFRQRVGGEIALELESKFEFFMTGLGYFNPHWGHGLDHGPLEVGYDEIDLAAIDPMAPDKRHIQTFCTARMSGRDGEREGVGVLEQIIRGAHKPSGFVRDDDTAP